MNNAIARVFTMVVVAGTISTSGAIAQEAPFLKQLESQGAQVTANGEVEGLPAYEVIPKSGTPYWVFVTPTNGAVMGVPFDKDGNAVALQASRRAQDAVKQIAEQATTQPVAQKDDVSPATVLEKIEDLPNEEFLNLTENLPGFWVGSEGPRLTIFMDARCPYCERLYDELKPLAEQGVLQYRVVPVNVFKGKSVVLRQVVEADPKQRQQIWEEGSLEPRSNRSNATFSHDTEELAIISTATLKRWSGRLSVPFSIYETKTGELRQVTGTFSREDALRIIEGAR